MSDNLNPRSWRKWIHSAGNRIADFEFRAPGDQCGDSAAYSPETGALMATIWCPAEVVEWLLRPLLARAFAEGVAAYQSNTAHESGLPVLNPYLDQEKKP